MAIMTSLRNNSLFENNAFADPGDWLEQGSAMGTDSDGTKQRGLNGKPIKKFIEDAVNAGRATLLGEHRQIILETPNIHHFAKNSQYNTYRDVPLLERDRFIFKNRAGGTLDVDAYLHATIIRCARSDYIFTQTPRPNTRFDFWRAVLQEDCKVVVCLLSLVGDDHLSMTDTPWWPMKRKGRITVKPLIKKDSGFPPIALRTLDVVDQDMIPMDKKRRNKMRAQMSKSASLNNDPDFMVFKMEVHCSIYPHHQVYLLHYRRWPRHGFPNVQSLLKAIKTVWNLERITPQENLIGLPMRPPEKVLDSNKNASPLTVVCDDGVTRTCTFVAVDLCARDAEKQAGKFDVEFVASDIRDHRYGAFDHLPHYRFVYTSMFAYSVDRQLGHDKLTADNPLYARWMDTAVSQQACQWKQSDDEKSSDKESEKDSKSTKSNTLKDKLKNLISHKKHKQDKQEKSSELEDTDKRIRSKDKKSGDKTKGKKRSSRSGSAQKDLDETAKQKEKSPKLKKAEEEPKKEKSLKMEDFNLPAPPKEQQQHHQQPQQQQQQYQQQQPQQQQQYQQQQQVDNYQQQNAQPDQYLEESVLM